MPKIVITISEFNEAVIDKIASIGDKPDSEIKPAKTLGGLPPKGLGYDSTAIKGVWNKLNAYARSYDPRTKLAQKFTANTTVKDATLITAAAMSDYIVP